MSCQRISRLISQSQDRSLSVEEQRAVREHVASCEDCHRLSDTSAGLAAGFQYLAAGVPSKRLAERAVTRWTSEAASRQMGRPNRPAVWMGVAVAAAAAMTLFLVTRPTLREGRPPRGTATASLSPHGAKGLGANAPGGQNSIPRRPNHPAVPPLVHSLRSLHTPETGGHVHEAVPSAPNRPVGDMKYVNGDLAQFAQRWGRLTPDDTASLQRQGDKLVRRGDDFVLVPFPALASRDERSVRAAVAAYKQEKEVIDARLARKVTLGVKGMAFSDLCEQLSRDTGIELMAGKTTADDKVTIFCKEKPLRDVMRQVTRVFGFAWRRSGEAGSYRYELAQDLRSQLMEEEMRSKDRNEALIALDREMERYRKYLGLSPEEAKKRAESASPEEKELLEQYSGRGWGPANLYFNLAPEEMNALRSGERLSFSAWQVGGERAMPAELERGIIQSQSDVRVSGTADTGYRVRHVKEGGEGALPSAVPEARAKAALSMDRGEVGRFTLHGTSGIAVPGREGGRNSIDMGLPLGVGESPSVRSPKNASANAKLASDPSLKAKVNIKPQPSVKLERDPLVPPHPDESDRGENSGARATSADVMEAIHKASGMDVIADYYTKFYVPAEISCTGATLFAGLSQISDRMRTRWSKQEGWLQLRSTGFFNDRLQEVPTRLLRSWAAARKDKGHLGVDELIEMAQLADAQLDAAAAGLGARAQHGLVEWELVHNGNLRAYWRFMGSLSTGQRATLMSASGLSLDKLRPSIQERFVATVIPRTELAGMGWVDLSNATLKLEYQPPVVPASAPADAKYLARFTCVVGVGGRGRWLATVEPFRRSASQVP
jgi:hypothetical protein